MLQPEQEAPRLPHNAREAFGLTEHENLYYRLSETRFQELLQQESTTIHEVRADSKNYRSFLFVTISRNVGGKQYGLTFYGLGHHDSREQWITDHWYWYEVHSISHLLKRTLSKAEAARLIQERRDEIAGEVAYTELSARGAL